MSKPLWVIEYLRDGKWEPECFFETWAQSDWWDNKEHARVVKYVPAPRRKKAKRDPLKLSKADIKEMAENIAGKGKKK